MCKPSKMSPPYFTLLPNFEVRLTTHALPGTTWKAHVTFRDPLQASGERSLILASTQTIHTPYIPPPPHQVYHAALLKSNLQKAVRRGHQEAAVATAWQLARQGPAEVTELLRRLPIILLEDTFLHAGILSRWVWWCLASSRGWVLSQYEWQQLLLDVAFIANTQVWSHRERLSKTDATQSPSALFDAANMYTDAQKAALFALWARSQWGGMLGDMAFLRALFATWKSRDPKGTLWRLATTVDPCVESLLVLAPLETLDFSVKDHGLPEAVDFHCVPHMTSVLAEQLGATKADVQAAIWFCRSGINVRVFVEDGTFEDEPAANLRDLFARMHFAPFVKKAWIPQQPPVRQQATLFRYMVPPVVHQQPMIATQPKEGSIKRTQSALPWISRL